MKRFEFGLEKVRRWRHEQVDMEELTLQRLLSEERKLVETRQRLEEEDSSARKTLSTGALADDLHRLDAFQKYVRTRSQNLDAERRQCAMRITQQRQRLTEALRRAELLDRLRTQSEADWRAAYQREQEEVAAELFLARRKRMRDDERARED